MTMADEIDRAQDAQATLIADALASHASRTQRRLPRPGPRECEVCGVPIPPERIAAVPNAVCCIECQTRRERW